MDSLRRLKPSYKSTPQDARVPTNEELMAKHHELTALRRPHARLSLPPDCKLIVGSEYCTAPRPSRNGSLRGTSEAYVLHFERFRRLVHEVIFGSGCANVVTIANNQRLETNAPDPMLALYGIGAPDYKQPPVLATNQPTRAAAAPKAGAPAFQPRVGAFEIAVALHTPVGKFGPSVVFSKLETGRFPRHDKLAELMTLRVVELLAQRDRHRVRSPREVITEPANVPPPPPMAATTRRTVQFGAVTTTTHRQPPAPPPPPSAEEGAWWPRLSPTKVEEGNLDWERMRQAALEAVKGLPPVEVPPRHALIVRFEYCIAERPGRNGSLRGSTITYAKHFEHMERHVLSLLPGVRILVNTPPPKVNHPPPPKAAREAPIFAAVASATLGASSRARAAAAANAGGGHKPRTWGMQPPNEITEWISAKPKAPHRSAPSLPDKPYAPRIDAFEVSVMLQGPSEHATYGPMLVHSKLSSGHFPVHAKALLHLHRMARECIAEAQRPGGSAFSRSTSSGALTSAAPSLNKMEMAALQRGAQLAVELPFARVIESSPTK